MVMFWWVCASVFVVNIVKIGQSAIMKVRILLYLENCLGIEDFIDYFSTFFRVLKFKDKFNRNNINVLSVFCIIISAEV
jgi:hypothetical protein